MAATIRRKERAIEAASLQSRGSDVLDRFRASSEIENDLLACAAGQRVCLSRVGCFGSDEEVGGEANSEIEKAAAEARHADVRRPEERRSGGIASQAHTM